MYASIMQTPLFSIITITFNAEAELPPTLASVDAQGFTDYEHLIIDGASTDGTIALARATASARRHIFSEPDKGLYDAMNKGMRRASGKYMIFLNAGDSFTASDTLALYAAAARQNPDIIYGDTQLVDAGRRVIGPRHLNVPEQLDFKSFRRGMLVCHQSFCVKRAIAPEYDLTYRFSADYEWCLRCLRQTSPDRCANLHTIVTDYLTDGLTDKNHSASLRERYRIMCHYYGTVPTLLRHIGFACRAALRKLRK